MLSEERRHRLLDLIQQKGSVTIGDAERRLGVSRMTVHRDLEHLCDHGLVRKVHGGAVAVAAAGSLYDPRAASFKERLIAHAEEKRAIARHVVRHLEGARTLVLDASSTAFYVAEALPSPEDIFLVAGGLPLFTELQRRHPRMRVALHGGEPLRTGSLVGPLAIASLAEVRVDWAVVSCLGVMEDEAAIYDAHPEEVQVKRAYLEHARRRLLAVDSSKFGVSGAYRFTSFDAFDAIVSEEGVRKGRRRRR
ncbi:MAG TPA: DeoR/GlpR family DNA-binding transcription regulator [Vicinamibacteria bacterium]|nr:DeoR/GlpR family DNA-binding transcription regulator [Vicinamibacteria bacterium]